LHTFSALAACTRLATILKQLSIVAPRPAFMPVENTRSGRPGGF